MAFVSSPADLTGVSVGRAEGAAFRDYAPAVIIRVICVLGLILANYYSWTMTVTGFVNAQFLPDNTVISNTYIPHIVAGFIQLGIFSFYLSIPFFSWRHFVSVPFVMIIAGALIALSALFALFSIMLTSQSENIVSYQFGRITGMNKSVTGIDDMISTAFTQYVNGQDALGKRACEGKDQSLTAICGPLAKGYYQQANKIRAAYSTYLETPGTYSETTSSNIIDSLTTLQGNYLKLSQKVATYQKFATDTDNPSAPVVQAFTTLGTDISTFSESLDQMNPDRKTMVLRRVMNSLMKIFIHTEEPLFYFALTIAFLPDMLSIVFTTLLLIMRTANYGKARLRRAAITLQEEAEGYDKLAKATGLWARARQKWQGQRRSAKVEDHVDRSVYETIPDRARE